MGPVVDLFALRRLVDEYAAALDGRDADRLAAVFLEDGKLTSFRPGNPEPFFELVGSEQLRTLLDRLARYTRTWHFVGNHVCEVDGDVATGVTYCLAHHFAEDEDGWFCRVAAVCYEDAYAKASGGWRFSSRIIRRVWAERRPIIAAVHT